jgi:hypothetical protein
MMDNVQNCDLENTAQKLALKFADKWRSLSRHSSLADQKQRSFFKICTVTDFYYDFLLKLYGTYLLQRHTYTYNVFVFIRHTDVCWRIIGLTLCKEYPHSIRHWICLHWKSRTRLPLLVVKGTHDIEKRHEGFVTASQEQGRWVARCAYTCRLRRRSSWRLHGNREGWTVSLRRWIRLWV